LRRMKTSRYPDSGGTVRMHPLSQRCRHIQLGAQPQPTAELDARIGIDVRYTGLRFGGSWQDEEYQRRGTITTSV
jgi:hypothetical protein